MIAAFHAAMAIFAGYYFSATFYADISPFARFDSPRYDYAAQIYAASPLPPRYAQRER